MDSLQIFGLASQQAAWLAARQSAISHNIANSNTPGYRTVDVQPFAKVLEMTGLEVSVTAAGQQTTSVSAARPVQMRDTDSTDTLLSGNNVSVEQEMEKAGEVNRNFMLNTGIEKAFHRMLLSAVKA